LAPTLNKMPPPQKEFLDPPLIGTTWGVRAKTYWNQIMARQGKIEGESL